MNFLILKRLIHILTSLWNIITKMQLGLPTVDVYPHAKQQILQKHEKASIFKLLQLQNSKNTARLKSKPKHLCNQQTLSDRGPKIIKNRIQSQNYRA